MVVKKSFVVPILLTGLCFISAYLYLIIVGDTRRYNCAAVDREKGKN